MCGIYGLFRLDGGASADSALAQARRIAHRGPDGQGSYLSEDGRLALAHRRLAIVDLSPSGHQPMLGPDGRSVITFNGEIYNFRELSAELVALGHVFRGTSDTEVLLASYAQWGVDCLKRLTGMFAFCIADLDGQGNVERLFLARDRAGEKPLYFTHGNGTFEFASDPMALSIQLQIDPAGLNTYLALGYSLPQSCLHSGVSQVFPGHFLIVNGRDAVPKPQQFYWELPSGWDGKLRSDEELAEEAEELLIASVRRQLLADVPVGVFLSGGLDSSLVVAAAARTNSSINTFTVGFPNREGFDETSHAELVARHFGTTHRVLDGSQIFDDPGAEMFGSYGEPIADSSVIPTYHLSRMAREHVTVALGGDGGDELFGGYPQYRQSLRLAHKLRSVPGWLLAGGATVADLLPAAWRGRAMLASLRGGGAKHRAFYSPYFGPMQRRAVLSPEVASRLSAQDISWPERYREALFDNMPTAIEGMTAMDFQSYLSGDILTKVDRASMAVSLETRAPWLDHKIVEFCFSKISPQQRATPEATRIIQKALVKRMLPPQFNADRKQGFSLPINDSASLFATALREGGPLPGLKGSSVKRLAEDQRHSGVNGGRLAALYMYKMAVDSNLPSAP